MNVHRSQLGFFLVFIFLFDCASSLSSDGPGAQEIVKHAQLLQELKGSQKTEEKKNITSHTHHNYTQTESYIRTMFDDYNEPMPASTLDYYINQLLHYSDVDATQWDIYRPILIQIYENEKKHSQDYVFYHGYKKELGLVFDIYKELFDLMNIASGSDQIVLIRDIMKPRTYHYSNVNEFLDFWPTTQFYKDQITKALKFPDQAWLGGWNDAKDPLRTLILSANISLFGNLLDHHANSVYFFAHSKSYTETAGFLKSFFKIWKFDEKYIADFDALQKELLPETISGHMLQIFIPRELVDQLVYASAIYGLPYPYKITGTFDEHKRRHTDMLSILNLYRSDAASLVTSFGVEEYEHLKATPAAERSGPSFFNTAAKYSIDGIQARILLMPELFDPKNNIKMFRFSLSPEAKIQEYKKRLKSIVQNMLSDWLNDSKNQAYFNKLNLPLSKLAGYIKQGKEYVSLDSSKGALQELHAQSTILANRG